MLDTPFARGMFRLRLLTADRCHVALRVAMTMSIHKLTAGSGYDYLTRQVAAFDATAKGHVGLASYYDERGESPGAWIGSGMVGIDGLQACDPVTSEQMLALFGAGMHPLAAHRLQQLSDANLSDDQVRAATRLGGAVQSYAHHPQSIPGPGRQTIRCRYRIGRPACCRSAGHAGGGSAGVLSGRTWPVAGR